MSTLLFLEKQGKEKGCRIILCVMAYKAKIAAGQHSSMQIPQYHILEY